MAPAALKFWDSPALDWSSAGAPPMPKSDPGPASVVAVRRKKVEVPMKKEKGTAKPILVDWSQIGLKEARVWMLHSVCHVENQPLPPRGPMPAVRRAPKQLKQRGSDRRGAKSTMRIQQPGGGRFACNRMA